MSFVVTREFSAIYYPYGIVKISVLIIFDSCLHKF